MSSLPKPRRPHLLYVAWSYPPARNAGMYRALATANAFAAAGWDVTVLTATRDTYTRLTGTDAASESAVDPSITIDRIPFDPQRGETDLRTWSRFRLYSPPLWNYLRWFTSKLGFPELGYASWRRPLVRAAERIHQGKPVDLVLGTANPYVDFVPGAHLHRHHGVPYVMDHRDAWHLDVYTGRRVGSRRSRRLEARYLADAAETWFVNQPILDWHARQHPELASRFHLVANGFDEGFLDAAHDRMPDPAGLVFGYLGTIYGPIPLREALEGWRLARTRSDVLARARLVFRGRLGHFAEPDAIAAGLLEEFRNDGVAYEGPVSKTDVSSVYRGFDAVLLIISHSKYVTSGKVYEYAATGLPLVSIHHPETAATSVLQGRDGWFPVDTVTPESIATQLIAAADYASTLTPEQLDANRRWAAPLSRDRQLAPRVAELTRRFGGGEQ